MKKFLSILTISIFLPIISHAHGLATSQIQPWDDLFVEFEYDGSVNIPAGEFTIFYVFLLDQNKNVIDFDNAYIKITKPNGSTALFGTILETEDFNGSAKLGGIMDEAGEYTAVVQLTRAGKTFGPLNYKFTVSPTFNSIVKNNPQATKNYLLVGILGLATGLIVGLKIRKK